MAEIHTYPEMNAQIKDLLRIGEQPICLYAAKRIEELEEYERNKGEWLEDFNGFETIYRCSNCSEKPLTKYGTMHDYVLSEFCPHCGADMRGET